MGDMGDYWRDVKPALIEESKRKRANNRESSARILTEAGIPFEAKNNGAHLIIETVEAFIDFWPGTGLWCVRGTDKYRRGEQHLILHLKRKENSWSQITRIGFAATAAPGTETEGQ
jgi:hypothetical protein